MSLYNRYVLTVSLCLLASTVAMVAAGLQNLHVYFIVYVFEALVVSELYVYFNRKVRRALSYVSVMLFAGFTISMGLKVYSLLF